MKEITKFQKLAVLGILALLSLGGYLAVSAEIYGLGFPLDDAWIHQVYARNVAEQGVWRFSGAESSGGSTGPLWSALIAVWYVLGVSPLWGTYIFGWLMLWMVGSAGMFLYRSLFLDDGSRWGDVLAGAALILEWHLVWAAGSGMETLLFTLLVLLILLLILRSDLRSWVLTGALIGLSIWVRPGGVTLLFVLVFGLALGRGSPKQRLRRSGFGLLGFAGFFLPYLGFNYWIAGAAWPNTFFAKQAEYAALRQIPLINRIGQLSIQPLTGPALVLLPGVLLTLIYLIRSRRWTALAGLCWAGGYTLMYSIRLPVSYQHGRYLVPVIPVLILFGWGGLMNWIGKSSFEGWRYIISRAWVGILVLILGIFWGLGAKAYGRDVGVIETEMVRTAVWIDLRLEDNAVLGAHDIGALGYFTGNKIVDLAGLVSPDVIPFIRDEKQLARYLDAQGADYLVAFPGWYPELTAQSHPIYQSGGRFAPQFGSDHLTVYQWHRAK